MLFRKMIRDILENKLAYVACAIVITIGLVAYTSMSMAKDNLFIARDEFFRQNRLADGFATIKSMPYAKLSDIRDIQGIDKVQGRLVKDVRVLMPDSEKNVYLRLVSLDLNDKSPLDDISVQKGAMPDGKGEEILLADKFLTANHLKIGDKLTVVIEGKKTELVISGSGQSPEFVYAMKNPQNIAPDPESFEIAYMPYDKMENLFSLKGMINDITFTLKPGTEFLDIEQKVKNELDPYFLESLIEKKDQLSYTMLNEELKQLEKSAKSIPILFLAIAAIILYIMLKRLVESQRSQIGTMKAFGYRSGEIILHYLSYGAIVGLVGGIAGGLLGSLLADSMTKIYQNYYSLPNLTSRFSMDYFVLGIILSVVFSIGAAYQGVKGILKLQPVDAMHPPVPVFNKKSILEKIPGFWSIFTVQGRMAVRNALRNRGRTFFIFIGIMFTFSMMATMLSMNSMMDIMVVDQFTKVQKHDIKVSFSQPLSLKESLRELQAVEGIKRIEPMLEVPVTLRFKHYKKDISALGISGDSELYNILDKKGNRVEVPKEGILLSEQVAKKIKARVGDRLQVDSIWAKENPMYVTVAGIVPQYLGSNVYMDYQTLTDMLGSGEMATSMLIAMEDDSINHFKQEYKTAKNIGNIEERAQTIAKYKELMGTSAYSMWIMAILAVITGFAIVYNSSIISLAERKRELASLRVLGMTPKEVLQVISVEQWITGIMGIIAGIPLAFAMNKGIASSMSSDIYSLPVVTDMTAIIQAFVGTVIAIITAQLWVGRKVAGLDLVEVLKERD